MAKQPGRRDQGPGSGLLELLSDRSDGRHTHVRNSTRLSDKSDHAIPADLAPLVRFSGG